MNPLGAAVATEFLKARRSKVPWLVASGFSLAPLVGGLFMVVLKDPGGARRLGLLGAKAQLTAGAADWPTYLSLLAQSVAVGGGVLFAFLTAWVFGREFADRTVRTLLAVPAPRWAIVAAKLVVVATWCGAATAWVLGLGLGIGWLVGLPGWSRDAVLGAVGTSATAALLTIVLQTTTAFFAGAGRGYLPPLAWMVLTVVLAQVLTVLGRGAWFPWAVPALVAGAAGPRGEAATAAGVVVVVVAALLGLAATLTWRERADQAG
jgi:ABC-2 type transport system permease protein